MLLYSPLCDFKVEMYIDSRLFSLLAKLTLQI